MHYKTQNFLAAAFKVLRQTKVQGPKIEQITFINNLEDYNNELLLRIKKLERTIRELEKQAKAKRPTAPGCSALHCPRRGN